MPRNTALGGRPASRIADAAYARGRPREAVASTPAMLGPTELYDDPLPPSLKGRLTATEALAFLAVQDRAREVDRIVAERTLLWRQGNRGTRRATAAKARSRSHGGTLRG